MLIRIIAFTTALVSFTSLSSYAQKKDFGDISKSMLQTEVYESDPTANAVVLFDVAEAYIDEELEVVMTRHVRIKVLTDDGLNEGDISLGFRHEDPKQNISKLKVQSYELTGSGKVKTHKLGRRDKFENKVSDTWSDLKFVVPNLKKGSIFEYEYTWKSETIYDLKDWYFQRSIPVMWSEYKVAIPEWLTFLVFKRSYHDFDLDEIKKYSDTALFRYEVSQPGSFVRSDRSTQQTERIPYNGNEYHWIMKDLPAIKNEPFMKAKIDYYAQVQLQLARVQFPNSMAETVLNSWPELVEALEKNDEFGRRIDGNRFLKDVAQNEISGASTDTEKMINLYKHVANTVNWNKDYDLFADNKLKDVYESGNGSSSEINLLLTQLLREAGLDASPIIISTRNNGEIIDLYPLTSQFNHTLVYVEVDGVPQILDATDKNRPYNILPPSVLNDKGLLIKGDESRWVPLKNTTSNKIRHLVNISLDDNGNLKGKVSAMLSGQFSYVATEQLENKSDVKDVLFNNDEKVNIDTLSVEKPNEKGEAKYNVEFNISNYINPSDTIAYFNFNTLDTEFDNPFKLQERKYPIDYEFEFSNDLTMTVILPNGWIVEEGPKSMLHRLKDGKGEFKRLVQVNGNIITMLYSMKINRKRFMPDEYIDLKTMYELMESSFEENFVLKKRS